MPLATAVESSANFTSNRTLRELYSRGQLLLSLSTEDSTIKLHVLQTRQLPLQDNQRARARIFLHPSDTSTNATTVNLSAGDAFFHTNILPGTDKHRLIITVEKIVSDGDYVKTIGSMSFGLKHLVNVNKKIQGWYHLLPEDIGMHKHLQVASKQLENMPPSSSQNLSITHDVSTMTLTRSQSTGGFGFSVRGACPVRVCRVDADSPAFKVGLRQGHILIKVNDRNVAQSTAEAVTRLVKKTPMVLKLQVQSKRNLSPIYLNDSQTKFGPAPSPKLQHFRQQKYDVTNLNNNAYCDWLPVDESENERTTWQEWSPIKGNNSHTQTLLSSFDLDEGICGDDFLDADINQLDQAKYLSFEANETANNVSALSTASSFSPHSKRQHIVSRLLQTEEQFASRVRKGVACFVRPLRLRILTASQHGILFQNLEKLAAISEYQVRQMRETNLGSFDLHRCEDKFVDSVGEVYRTKMQLLCDAYRSYNQGLPAAEQLLKEIQSAPKFSAFLGQLKKHMGGFSAEKFIDEPRKHFAQLHSIFKDMLNNTPELHPDYKDVADVSAGFKKCHQVFVNGNISDLSANSSGSSGVYVRSRSVGSIGSLSSVSSEDGVSCQSDKSTHSVDSEVLEIQSRLLFPQDIDGFCLAHPLRHVIYTGEVLHQGQSALMTLFSDMILLARRDQNGYLTVIKEPSLLCDTSLLQFNNLECGRSASLELAFGDRMGVRCQFKIDFHTKQDAFTWRALIEQRLRLKKTNNLQ